MSKRIFADRQTHPPTTEQGRVPNCYYHKLPITHFCTKSIPYLIQKNAHYPSVMTACPFTKNSI